MIKSSPAIKEYLRFEAKASALVKKRQLVVLKGPKLNHIYCGLLKISGSQRRGEHSLPCREVHTGLSIVKVTFTESLTIRP